MKTIDELLAMTMEEFTQELIKEGEFSSPQDVKVFVLECLNQAHHDPSTEFPIKYYDKDEQIPGGVEYLPCEGPQLTDEFVNENRENPNMPGQIPGQMSLFPEDNK